MLQAIRRSPWEEAEKINMYFGEVSTYNKVSGTGYFSDKDIRRERIFQPL